MTAVDRFAVFVDAGYLYAEVGKLCCGTRERKSIRLNGSGVNDLLVQMAANACGLPSLRTYWYDGARKGIPTLEQKQIAALPNVKLRLGRLNIKNRQKGVDALIYRDLMTLAREHAICEAFVLSGDEDLREGVRTAQDLGTRVTLIGIATGNYTRNQSRELVDEADEAIMLTKQELADLVRPLQPPGVGRASAHADIPAAVSAAATQYARQWVEQATDEEIKSLQARRPMIPKPMDASLLGSIENEVGTSLRGREELRRATRRAFWEQIARGANQPDTGSNPSPTSDLR